ESLDGPAVNQDHGAAQALGERYLTQRPPSPADGDDRLRGGDDERVPGLAEPGGERDRQERVGPRAMRVGQEADHQATGPGRALARRAGDSTQPPVDHDRAGLGEHASDLLGDGELLGRRLGRAAYGDVSAWHADTVYGRRALVKSRGSSLPVGQRR